MTGRLGRGVAASGVLALALIVGYGPGAAETPIDRGVGERVANFTLDDTTGRHVSLYGYAGAKALVLVFLGTDCPIANLYAPRLAELHGRYKDKGVVFLAV